MPRSGLRATRLGTGGVVVSFDVSPPSEALRALEHFPAAERGVVGMMLEGLSDAQIAARRSSSRHTVSNLLRSAYRRAGVNSRGELAAWLVAGGALAEDEWSSSEDDDGT